MGKPGQCGGCAGVRHKQINSFKLIRRTAYFQGRRRKKDQRIRKKINSARIQYVLYRVSFFLRMKRAWTSLAGKSLYYREGLLRRRLFDKKVPRWNKSGKNDKSIMTKFLLLTYTRKKKKKKSRLNWIFPHCSGSTLNFCTFNMHYFTWDCRYVVCLKQTGPQSPCRVKLYAIRTFQAERSISQAHKRRTLTCTSC